MLQENRTKDILYRHMEPEYEINELNAPQKQKKKLHLVMISAILLVEAE